MTGDDEVHPLSMILQRLDLLQDEYIDFSEAGDPLPQVTYLTISAMYLNIVGVLEFGGRSGAVRQEGLVEQIVASAFQTYGEYDPHPGPFDKAAMLL